MPSPPVLPPAAPQDSPLDALLGRTVVLDVASPFVFLGTLAAVGTSFLTLEEADVHDLRDTATTREEYVLTARRFGPNPNRRRVYVRLSELVSVSALDDAIA